MATKKKNPEIPTKKTNTKNSGTKSTPVSDPGASGSRKKVPPPPPGNWLATPEEIAAGTAGNPATCTLDESE